MNASELPGFGAKEQPIRSESPEAFLGTYEIDLIDKLNFLRLSLENDRSPDVMSYCFTFQDEELADMYLPEQVKQLEKRHGQLASAIVECSYLDNCGGSSFELRMKFCDNDKNTAWLTVTRPYNHGSTSNYEDTVAVHHQNPVAQTELSYHLEAFTAQEFNRCLGSLVYNSPLISPSVFDQFDWHNDDYFIMTENFKHAAKKTWSNHEYLLTDNEGGYAGSLSYFKTGDDVSEIRLSRVANYEAYVTGNGLTYNEKLVELSLPLSRLSEIELLEHSITENSSSTQICMPVESDYQTALAFIEDQLSSIKEVQTESFNDEKTQPLDD